MTIAFAYFLICAGLALLTALFLIARNARSFLGLIRGWVPSSVAFVISLCFFVAAVILAAVFENRRPLDTYLVLGTLLAGLPCTTASYYGMRWLLAPRPRTKIPQARTVNR